jgi:hypothetical protein
MRGGFPNLCSIEIHRLDDLTLGRAIGRDIAKIFVLGTKCGLFSGRFFAPCPVLAKLAMDKLALTVIWGIVPEFSRDVGMVAERNEGRLILCERRFTRSAPFPSRRALAITIFLVH